MGWFRRKPDKMARMVVHFKDKSRTSIYGDPSDDVFERLANAIIEHRKDPENKEKWFFQSNTNKAIIVDLRDVHRTAYHGLVDEPQKE